jgi:hypothetical protein
MVMPIKPDKNVGTAMSLDPEVIQIIDRERRDMPRSTWVNDLILEVYRE